MRINCIIVDDQIESVELLSDHVKNIPALVLKYTSTNPIEALTFLEHEQVDCIFLDIEMPQLTGLEFIETLKYKLGNAIPKIILITGYDQYAVTGYDYGVFDYLLKPISFKRFKIAIDRLTTALQPIAEIQAVREFIFVDVDGKKIKVLFNEVVYIEGAGNYILLVTSDKRLFTIRQCRVFRKCCLQINLLELINLLLSRSLITKQ